MMPTQECECILKNEKAGLHDSTLTSNTGWGRDIIEFSWAWGKIRQQTVTDRHGQQIKKNTMSGNTLAKLFGIDIRHWKKAKENEKRPT